jgi:tRNA-Thr(GGU) m(6)t(6)A37 methyltransferase TsaA
MEGTPIQGAFAPDAKGTVEVYPEFADGLEDVELFSHLYLMYAFHMAGPAKLTCVPFLDDRPHGLFATRAPRRPNPIGLSIVRLTAREGRILHIAEVDVLDGTPLLDIKPYVPQMDHRPEATSGWLKNTTWPAATEGADNRFDDESDEPAT